MLGVPLVSRFESPRTDNMGVSTRPPNPSRPPHSAYQGVSLRGKEQEQPHDLTIQPSNVYQRQSQFLDIHKYDRVRRS